MRLNNKTKVYGGSIIGLVLVYLGYLKIQAKKKEGYKKHGSIFGKKSYYKKPCGSCSA
tara:strand:- start:467 stop:640 length:174 start_codon:yes stop_codon:yes gene_type:complete